MTITEALKARKTTMIKNANNNFWEVRIDAEVVEPVYITEYIKASSKAEAQAIALKHFKKRSPVLIHDRADRIWQDDNRHRVQHPNITKTTKRKKFTFSELQRKVLKGLMCGMYLERPYTNWYLKDPVKKDKYGNQIAINVSGMCIDALLRKGVLIDLITSNMSKQEVAVQTAIGSLPTIKAYTVDKEVVKTLGLHL